MCILHMHCTTHVKGHIVERLPGKVHVNAVILNMITSNLNEIDFWIYATFSVPNHLCLNCLHKSLLWFYSFLKKKKNPPSVLTVEVCWEVRWLHYKLFTLIYRRKKMTFLSGCVRSHSNNYTAAGTERMRDGDYVVEADYFIQLIQWLITQFMLHCRSLMK